MKEVLKPIFPLTNNSKTLKVNGNAQILIKSDNLKIKPVLFKKRKKDIRYSIDSWKGYFYVHTNEDARDYKVLRCKTDQINKLETFISAKKETVIGGLDFLDDYILRGEKYTLF